MSGPIKTQDVHPHGGFNKWLALFITNHVGTMWAAYIFAVVGVGSIVGLVTGNAALGLICGALSSYFLQLVLLPVIMVGQNVQSAHADARAEEDFAINQKAEAEIEKVLERLEALDTKILELVEKINGTR